MDSVKKYYEMQEEAKGKVMTKADPVMVRLGFTDRTVTMKEAMSGEDICSCISFVVGYEDEYGNECDAEGNYL